MLMVRDGKPGAFEQLVERYQCRVMGLLYHMVGDTQEAEDLAQEVFFRIYRARAGYKPEAKFSTWLFTIANNLALNAIRDRKRKPANDLPANPSGPLGERPLEQLISSPSGAMPSKLFAKGELAEIVRMAVQQLPEDQRMAVILNKFEEMNYRQIGEVMDRSEMAVKSLLARARNTLREMLEPYLATGDRPQAS